MSYVVNTVQQIRARLRPGQLVVLESTTYPGTTDELVLRILEESGLKCGREFYLAFSPEREDPGNGKFSTATIPKIVGGVDQAGGDLAQSLYDQVVVRTVRVGNSREAEAAKLVENIFRAVNIALVNELKIVFDRMGIDIWSVLDAAATKPFGFMRFNPGPGWGGHCIPLDPFYLSWKAREYGVTPKFIELAGEVNVQMPEYVIDKLSLALNDRRKAARGSRILVLGIAYKKDIDDPRESPAFEIIEGLLQLGAEVTYHDPHVPKAPRMRSWPDLPPMTSEPLTEDVLKSPGRGRDRDRPFLGGLRTRGRARELVDRHPRASIARRFPTSSRPDSCIGRRRMSRRTSWRTESSCSSQAVPASSARISSTRCWRSEARARPRRPLQRQAGRTSSMRRARSSSSRATSAMPSVCRDACAGVHVVFHQAALGSVPRSMKDPATSIAVNVGGTANVFAGARDAGVATHRLRLVLERLRRQRPAPEAGGGGGDARSRRTPSRR